MAASGSGRIVRNIQFKFLAEGISRVFSLGLFILIGRVLGDSGYGEYAYPLAFATLFSLLQDWGINTLIIRELAQDRQRLSQLLPSVVRLKLGLSLFTLGVTCLCAWALGFEALRLQHIFWATLITLGLGWIETLCALYIALEEVQEEVRLRTLHRLIGLIFTLIALSISATVSHLLYGLTLANGLAALYGSWRLWRLHPRWSSQAEPLWPLLRRSFPFWLTGLFVLLYLRIDVFMLGLFGRPDAEIGWYQAVVKGLDIFNLLPNLALLAMYPILSQLAARDQEGLKRLTGQALFMVMALTVPIGLVSIGLAPWGIRLTLGPDFEPAAPAFQILLGALPWMAMNQVFFYVLASLNGQRYTVYSTAFGLFLNVLLNGLWIPAWGYLGAATSTLITEGVVWGLNFWALTVVMGKVSIKGWSGLAAATAILLGVLCLPLPLFLRVGLGLGLYSGVLWQSLSLPQRQAFRARIKGRWRKNVKS